MEAQRYWSCLAGPAIFVMFSAIALHTNAMYADDSLSGAHIKVGAYFLQPYIATNVRMTGQARYSGAIPTMLQAMAGLENFTYGA